MTGGLGRLPAPDPRDRAFPMLAAPLAALPAHKYWSFFHEPLNQFGEGACVGFSWKHFLLAAPISTSRPEHEPTAMTIYREAQKIDEWEGEAYSGTSVRAGAKYLQERGMLGTYTWAFDAETVAQYLLSSGSVVLGTSWFEGMDHPSPGGTVTPTGRVRGGHAYLALGYSRARGAFRCLNSWGVAFGQKGRFWLLGEDLEALLADGGEACTAVESRPQGATP